MSDERHVIATFYSDHSLSSERTRIEIWSDGEMSLVVPGKEPVQIAKWGERPYRGSKSMFELCALPTRES
jgi:hypothetical protein